jgi:hypothetical protein
MFYVTEEDALKFWGYLKSETDDLESQADNLEAKLKERLTKWSYKDSFAIEWQAVTDARRIAVVKLRYVLEDALRGGEARDSSPIAVAALNSLISQALGDDASSNFSAANLVEDMSAKAFRQVVRNVFAHSFKVHRVEVAA